MNNESCNPDSAPQGCHTHVACCDSVNANCTNEFLIVQGEKEYKTYNRIKYRYQIETTRIATATPTTHRPPATTSGIASHINKLPAITALTSFIDWLNVPQLPNWSQQQAEPKPDPHPHPDPHLDPDPDLERGWETLPAWPVAKLLLSFGLPSQGHFMVLYKRLNVC